MTSLLTARVDTVKREKAERVFADVGLTTSAAVNLYISMVAMTGAIPFEVKSIYAQQDMREQYKQQSFNEVFENMRNQAQISGVSEKEALKELSAYKAEQRVRA